MSAKKTTATTTKTHSLVETLEGRQLFSAAGPTSDGDVTPEAGAKVKFSDIHFTATVNKSSAELPVSQKARTTDAPAAVDGGVTDGAIYGISFTTKVSKPSPK